MQQETDVAPSKYLIPPPQPPPPSPPPTAPSTAVHTKTISATLNGNERKRSQAAIAHIKTISAIVNGNEGKRPAATGQGGEIGAAEQRAAEWDLVLKTGDETGKPQGVKVRTFGDYIVWSLAKPSPHHGDAAYDSHSIN